jgi:hypothetical protein
MPSAWFEPEIPATKRPQTLRLTSRGHWDRHTISIKRQDGSKREGKGRQQQLASRISEGGGRGVLDTTNPAFNWSERVKLRDSVRARLNLMACFPNTSLQRLRLIQQLIKPWKTKSRPVDWLLTRSGSKHRRATLTGSWVTGRPVWGFPSVVEETNPKFRMTLKHGYPPISTAPLNGTSTRLISSRMLLLCCRNMTLYRHQQSLLTPHTSWTDFGRFINWWEFEASGDP